jgi:hypothetical protein
MEFSPKNTPHIQLTEVQSERNPKLLPGDRERIEFKFLKSVRSEIEGPAIVVLDLEVAVCRRPNK